MAQEPVHALLRYVRQVAGLPEGAAGTDGQLLRRFVRDRDETAFVALMQRHGPMVLGVCRRVLGHAQDAEDAFQATFLVLVRKAHAIAQAERLSNWLYGVAVRTASKLRVREARRRVHERRAGLLARVDPTAGPELDLCPVLDEEIQQLPKKYRMPFLLCYLEGKTNREAAEVLGCPPGTVSSRLAWARQRLRTRLERRGIVPGTGLAGIVLAESATGQAPTAAVSAELEGRTVQLALEFAAGKVVAAGGVSLRAVILTREVLRAMFWTSWKGLAVAGLMALSLIGAGVGVYASRMLVAGEPDGPPAAAQDKEPAKPEALKQEVIRLQAEVQRLQEEIARLRAKVEAQPNAAEPVLFRGKPASYWIQALKDRDPKYRADAVKALGGIAEVDQSVIPILIASLKDRNPDVRYQAAEAVSGLGAAALPALQEVMKGGSVEARDMAAMALGRIGRDAVPALAKALHDDDAVVRRAIVNLVQIGQTDDAAHKALQAAAKDSDVRVRRRLIEGISLITTNSEFGSGDFQLGSPILVEGLNDPDMEIRKLALTSLRRFFPTGRTFAGPRPTPPPGLVPALIKLLKDPKIDKSLREAAYDLLDRIDPAAAKEAIGLGGP
jgi:RNA polymerase sigma factor (sigma-70 family)